MDEQLKELYAMKGELTMQIEIAQAKLQQVTNKIIQLLNPTLPVQQ